MNKMSMTDYVLESAETKEGCKRDYANSRAIDRLLASGLLVVYIRDQSLPISSKVYYTPEKCPRNR